MRSSKEIREMQKACEIAGQTKQFQYSKDAHYYASALQWALDELDIDEMDDAIKFAEEHNWRVPTPLD